MHLLTNAGYGLTDVCRTHQRLRRNEGGKPRDAAAAVPPACVYARTNVPAARGILGSEAAS